MKDNNVRRRQNSKNNQNDSDDEDDDDLLSYDPFASSPPKTLFPRNGDDNDSHDTEETSGGNCSSANSKGGEKEEPSEEEEEEEKWKHTETHRPLRRRSSRGRQTSGHDMVTKDKTNKKKRRKDEEEKKSDEGTPVKAKSKEEEGEDDITKEIAKQKAQKASLPPEITSTSQLVWWIKPPKTPKRPSKKKRRKKSVAVAAAAHTGEETLSPSSMSTSTTITSLSQSSLTCSSPSKALASPPPGEPPFTPSSKNTQNPLVHEPSRCNQYFPCRVCQDIPSETKGLHLRKPQPEQVLLQVITLSGGGDKFWASPQRLIPFHNLQLHEEKGDSRFRRWCEDLCHVYHMQLKKKPKYLPTEALAEVYFLHRLREYAAEQEERLKQEEESFQKGLHSATKAGKESSKKHDIHNKDIENDEDENDEEELEEPYSQNLKLITTNPNKQEKNNGSTSSSVSSSSDEDDEDDAAHMAILKSGRKKEPLRAGDVIMYRLQLYVAGDVRGIRTSRVLEVHASTVKACSRLLVTLESGEVVPPEGQVKRVQIYNRRKKVLEAYRFGCFRALEDFKLIPSTFCEETNEVKDKKKQSVEDESVSRKARSGDKSISKGVGKRRRKTTDGKMVAQLLNEGVANLREKAEELGLPCDILHRWGEDESKRPPTRNNKKRKNVKDDALEDDETNTVTSSSCHSRRSPRKRSSITKTADAESNSGRKRRMSRVQKSSSRTDDEGLITPLKGRLDSSSVTLTSASLSASKVSRSKPPLPRGRPRNHGTTPRNKTKVHENGCSSRWTSPRRKEAASLKG